MVVERERLREANCRCGSTESQEREMKRERWKRERLERRVLRIPTSQRRRVRQQKKRDDIVHDGRWWIDVGDDVFDDGESRFRGEGADGVIGRDNGI